MSEFARTRRRFSVFKGLVYYSRNFFIKFVVSKIDSMDQINIFSGDEIISRVLMADGLADLRDILKPYDKVFAVMDDSVAENCPYAAEIAEILNEKGAPGMLVEATEANKRIGAVNRRPIGMPWCLLSVAESPRI